MSTRFNQKAFEEAALPLVESMGLTLWGVEYLPAGRKSILRIFVDDPSKGAAHDNSDEGPGGVLLDQCAQVSRHLSVLLDAEDLVPGSYTLEVSSPGLRRPFFHLGQLEGYLGREVELALTEPVLSGDDPGRKRFAGRVESVDADTGAFRLLVDGAEMDFSWDMVKKLSLVHHFPDTSVRKGGKRS